MKKKKGKSVLQNKLKKGYISQRAFKEISKDIDMHLEKDVKNKTDKIETLLLNRKNKGLSNIFSINEIEFTLNYT